MSRPTLSASLLLGGAGLGILLFGFVRFAALPKLEAGEFPHFHANFAVFVGGERLDLSGEKYMEDLASCRVDPLLMLPLDRTHMHERNQDVVHVHARGVTWGHFFANIGFTLRDDFLRTDAGVTFEAGEGGTLKFVLNGASAPSVFNELIGSEDRLLISYGPESAAEVLETQFDAVQANAHVFNEFHRDGAGCSVGPPEETRSERLRRAFWF